MSLTSKMIGNKIADARKKINLSQAELAKYISISPQAVGKWERGESMPDISTLGRLTEILKVDLNYFADIQSQPLAVTQESNGHAESLTSKDQKPKAKFDWNWDMSEGNWADADFSGLKNLKEKFSSSNVKNCLFKNSDLSELMLGKNNLERCDFTGSNIRESRFRSSNLLDCQFNQCSFIDAELLKCNVEKCNFSGADFSGAEFQECNVENSTIDGTVWKFTKLLKSNFSQMVFSGTLENCHFEYCDFHQIKFEDAILINTFFKYNERMKKVQFVNCEVDTITFAFLKNNQANLTGLRIIS